MRLPAPNYTQTPNDLFDYWLPRLSEGELKVLLVIMRKTFGWHKHRDRISCSQLAKVTGLNDETVRISAKSLCKKGVIKREVVGQNGSQETFYEVVMYEENSNNYDRADKPGGPGGLAGGGDRADYPPHKRNPSTKETATAKKSDAAAFSEDSEKEQPKQPYAKSVQSKPPIYECLDPIDIPRPDKIEITTRYGEDAVKNAIEWVKSPHTKITTTLVQAIKWACKNSPEIPKEKKDLVAENRSLAQKYDGLESQFAKVEALNKHVEIVLKGCQRDPIVIAYEEKGFKEQFTSALRKANLPLKEKNNEMDPQR
jgi:phage replication O-like protein O